MHLKKSNYKDINKTENIFLIKKFQKKQNKEANNNLIKSTVIKLKTVNKNLVITMSFYKVQIDQYITKISKIITDLKLNYLKMITEKLKTKIHNNIYEKYQNHNYLICKIKILILKVEIV